MLVNKTVNMSAACKITEEGDVIMTLTGYVDSNGKWSVSRYIDLPVLYNTNKELMDADEDAFTSMLLSKVGQIGDGN